MSSGGSCPGRSAHTPCAVSICAHTGAHVRARTHTHALTHTNALTCTRTRTHTPSHSHTHGARMGDQAARRARAWARGAGGRRALICNYQSMFLLFASGPRRGQADGFKSSCRAPPRDPTAQCLLPVQGNDARSQCRAIAAGCAGLQLPTHACSAMARGAHKLLVFEYS